MLTTICLNAKGKVVLKVASDYRCPYNCEPDSAQPGFLVEILKEIFSIYDIEIDYQLLSKSQAIESVQTGQIDAVLGIGPLQEQYKLLAPAVPIIYYNQQAFVKNSDDQWIFDGAESLRGKRLGFVFDYDAITELQSYILTTYPVSPERFKVEEGKYAVINLLASLIEGQADVIIEDEKIVEYYLQTINLKSAVKAVGKVNKNPQPLYIAFTANVQNQQYIQFFKEGLAALKATGEYDLLRAKYKIEAYE